MARSSVRLRGQLLAVIIFRSKSAVEWPNAFIKKVVEYW